MSYSPYQYGNKAPSDLTRQCPRTNASIFLQKMQILTDRKIKISLPSLQQINYNTVIMTPEFFFLFQFQILTLTFMTMIFLPMNFVSSGVFTYRLKLYGQFLCETFCYFDAKISISFWTLLISILTLNITSLKSKILLQPPQFMFTSGFQSHHCHIFFLWQPIIGSDLFGFHQSVQMTRWSRNAPC